MAGWHTLTVQIVVQIHGAKLNKKEEVANGRSLDICWFSWLTRPFSKGWFLKVLSKQIKRSLVTNVIGWTVRGCKVPDL